MSRLSSKKKGEVQCILMSFNFSAFDNKVGTKLSRHYKSFVGRDFKALAQCALFIFNRYFNNKERIVWCSFEGRFPSIYCKLNLINMVGFQGGILQLF